MKGIFWKRIICGKCLTIRNNTKRSHMGLETSMATTPLSSGRTLGGVRGERERAKKRNRNVDFQWKYQSFLVQLHFHPQSGMY